MSAKFRPKPAYFEQKSQIAPNSLVFHRNMADSTKLLLLALNGISSCAPNWTVVQVDLQNRLNWGRAKMQTAIRQAVFYGYLKVTQARQTENKKDENGQWQRGQFAQNEFEFDINGGYEKGIEFKPSTVDHSENNGSCQGGLSSGGSQPKVGLSSTCLSSTDNQLLPMPMSLPIPKTLLKKGNAKVANESALPFCAQKKQALDIKPSKTRKFKRKEEHQARFEYLMTLSLTDENNCVSEDEMSFLSHTYSKKQLEDTYCHLIYKMSVKNFNPRSVIATFKHLLKKELNPRGFLSEQNLQYARSFAFDQKWTELKVHDKYIRADGFSGKDISLEMDPMEFASALHNLYQSQGGRL